jgi:peptidoglycan/xylan/chitin deacetylase (PgdA/CDA1 family)
MSAKAVASSTMRRALRQAAIATDRLRPPPPGVTVLSYHQVDGKRPGSVNISSTTFDAQMALLTSRSSGCAPVGLDEAVDALGGGAPAGGHQVAVTFDDGTADFVEHALPVLVEHRVPVTLYLATAFVEDGRSFWDDGTVLSWAALRDALTTGVVSIGTHTHTHALLDRVDPQTAAREIETAVGLVEDRLGVSPAHFAYPKALAPARGAPADLAVRARVRSAAVAGGRVNRYSATDLWRLARSPVVAADDIDAFARKARGGLRLEGEVRERFDRIRYRRVER